MAAVSWRLTLPELRPEGQLPTAPANHYHRPAARNTTLRSAGRTLVRRWNLHPCLTNVCCDGADRSCSSDTTQLGSAGPITPGGASTLPEEQANNAPKSSDARFIPSANISNTSSSRTRLGEAPCRSGRNANYARSYSEACSADAKSSAVLSMGRLCVNLTHQSSTPPPTGGSVPGRTGL